MLLFRGRWRNRFSETSAERNELLRPQLKDRQRLLGSLEQEIIYYRDRRCAVCSCEVLWEDAEIHHVHPHFRGGRTILENGVLVHRDCHPKSLAETQDLE